MKIKSIRPPALRLLLLMLLGLPALFYWPLTTLITEKDSLGFLALLMVYCALITLVIIWEVGSEEWARWFSAAMVLAVVTLAPAFGFLKGWELWDKFRGSETAVEQPAAVGTKAAANKPVSSNDEDRKKWVWNKLRVGVTIVTVLPYALLVVNCFSVSGAIRRVTEFGLRTQILMKHTLIGLRVLQHVAEVLPPIVLVWREENPQLIIPRFRDDLGGIFDRAAKCSAWFCSAIWLWVRAGLTFAVEPIAIFCAEIETHFPNPNTNPFKPHE
jgi:hypothetical protein